MNLQKLATTYLKRPKAAWVEVPDDIVLLTPGSVALAKDLYWALKLLEYMYGRLAAETTNDLAEKAFAAIAREKRGNRKVVTQIAKTNGMTLTQLQTDAPISQIMLKLDGEDHLADFFIVILPLLEGIAVTEITPFLLQTSTPPDSQRQAKNNIPTGIAQVLQDAKMHFLVANILLRRGEKNRRLFPDIPDFAQHKVSNPVFFGIIAFLTQLRNDSFAAGMPSANIERLFKSFVHLGSYNRFLRQDGLYSMVRIYVQTLAKENSALTALPS